MEHELISLTKWPTMPAPMQSEDEGEAWIWGDFVAILQKNPMTCGALVTEMMNKLSKKRPSSPPVPSAMEYPYAMIVYYKKHKNPHGPSSRPILCVGIEKANYGALKDRLGELPSEFVESLGTGNGPLMVGVFRAGNRGNLGELDDFLTKDSARTKFFDVIRSELVPEGEPILIGNIQSIHGHPETGWAPIEADKKKGGCLNVFIAIAIAVPIFFSLGCSLL